MTEHFCTTHGTYWFKSGKMKSYAHPLKGNSGETVGWCNEESTDIFEETVGVFPTVTQVAPVDPTRKSIERQTSLKSATDWCIAQMTAGREVQTHDLLAVAAVFEKYLESGRS